jgi:lactonase
MSNSDRRTFLKSAVQTSLAAGVGFALPGLTRSSLAFAQAREDQNPPLPPNELALPQIKPEPWLKIDDRNVFLKGMAFDRKGNLTVVAAYPGPDPSKGLAGRLDRSILSISPDKKVTTLIHQPGLRMTDHAIHKDGRIFIACLSGEVMVANPDGSDVKPVPVKVNGKPTTPSDLVFDSKGSLYVTDFTGRVDNPTGGIYRYSPDFKSVELFGPNLVTPNGIAFSHDERTIWTACSIAKKVYRLDLDADGKTVKSAEAVYTVTGPGGDGIRVDMKGNFYLAMNFQGRIYVFDKTGKPIALVLMPGRDKGELLSTTNVEFKPGTDEAYAVGAGDTGGTWIYRFKGLAKGVPMYSHM